MCGYVSPAGADLNRLHSELTVFCKNRKTITHLKPDRPGNHLKVSKGSEKGNGAFASMISGGIVSGVTKATDQGRRVLKLQVFTRIEEICYT